MGALSLWIARATAFVTLLATLALVRAEAQPAQDALAVVERLHASLVETATVDPPLDLAERIEALAAVVEQTHDLTTMGRITVRRAWREWNETQRQAFSEAFARLSVTSYASRFAAVGEDTFGILGSESSGEDSADVHAVIRRPNAEDVPIMYSLENDGERWRIVNVFADGVSELGMMRSKYSGILESGDLDDLIAEIDSETAAL